jgi:phage shock protein PspC (stress-responsive transcriptional regulator)
MTDPTIATEPRSEQVRRLTRPRDGRILAGVCEGLGRYFGVPSLVYRIAFAALVLLAGSGIVLYAAAWLVMPEEGAEDSIAGEALRGRRERPWLLVGVGLVVFALILGVSSIDAWPDPGDVWVAALAVGLAVIWWQVREHRGRVEPSGRTVVAAAGETDTEVTRTDVTDTLVYPAAPPAPVAPRRRRLPIFLVAFGSLIAAAGLLGLLDLLDVVDVDWTLALAGGVIFLGVATAVGAFFGGAGALAALGAVFAMVLVLVAIADLPLRGSVGDRFERPIGSGELKREYQQAVGKLTLDLRDIELPPATTTAVSASVGIGELVLYVPEDIDVEVVSHVSAGEALVFGRRNNGWDVDRSDVAVAEGVPSAPELVLDADVGFGDIEVIRG